MERESSMNHFLHYSEVAWRLLLFLRLIKQSPVLTEIKRGNEMISLVYTLHSFWSRKILSNIFSHVQNLKENNF